MNILRQKLQETFTLVRKLTYHLRQWLDWKYKNPDKPREFNNDDLVFTLNQTASTSESL